MSPGRDRRGFTAIELLVVIGLIATITAIALPGVLRSLQRARVGRAATSVLRVHLLAQQLARAQAVPQSGAAVRSYGLAIVDPGDGRPQWCSLVMNDAGAASWSEVLVDREDGSQPLARFSLGAAIQAFHSATPTWSRSADDALAVSPSLVWWYQPGTGVPTRYPASLVDPAQIDVLAVDIGTPRRNASAAIYAISSGRIDEVFQRPVPAIDPSPVCAHLSVRSTDNAYRLALAVYRVGLANVAEF